MRKHPVAAVAAALIVAATTGPAGGQETGVHLGPRLQMYEATVDEATAEALAAEGQDVVSQRPVRDGVRIGLVLYPSDRDAMEGRGIDLRLWRNDEGLTARRLADQQAAGGFEVWRPYDGPGGIREYLYDVAADNPDIVKLEVVGMTHGTDPAGGDPTPREIVALKLTKNATTVPDGTRPAVLYSSSHHGRDWIGAEVTRRLLEWFVTGWREREPQIVDIVRTTELWFVPVANPDGYQYTFTHDRLWRKNLADVDGDGKITPIDGVDPTVPEHGAEPEARAMIEVLDRSHPEFQIRNRSFGEPSDRSGFVFPDREGRVRDELTVALDLALARAMAAADTVAPASTVTIESGADERRA